MANLLDNLNGPNESVEILKRFFADTYSNVIVGLNKDNDIVVRGTIFIVEDNVKKFPVKFHKLVGDLKWATNPASVAHTDLRTLENFPDIIEGNCFINGNKNLTSLEHCPKIITGTLDFSECNKITTLTGVSKSVNAIIATNTSLSDVRELFEMEAKKITVINTPVSEKKEIIEQITNILKVFY